MTKWGIVCYKLNSCKPSFNGKNKPEMKLVTDIFFGGVKSGLLKVNYLLETKIEIPSSEDVIENLNCKSLNTGDPC